MKSSLPSAGFCCLLFFATFGLSAQSQPLRTPAYKVGAILPLSGPQASLGESVKDGMLLAYESLAPEERAGLQLFFEDDEGQARNSVAAFQELLASNHIDLVVGALSNNGHALVPLTEKNGLAYIGVTVDPTIGAGTRGAVLLYPRVEDLAELAVKEALKRGYKKIALMCTQHVGNLAFKKAFLDANDNQLEVVLSQEALPDETDFRAYITRLHALPQLDAILNIMLVGQGPLFAKQAKQLGLKRPLFSLGNFEDRAAVKSSDGAMIGQWYVHADNPSEEFTKSYVKRFGIEPGLGSASGHDAIRLLALALKKKVEPKELGIFLRSVKDFKGEFGTFSSSPDNRYTIPVVVKSFSKEGFKRAY